jgi:hypothetical protein
VRAALATLLLAGCVGTGTPVTGPVVQAVADAPLLEYRVDASGNGAMVDAGTGPALVVSGAADATDARRAIHDYCGNTTPFNPDADTDAMWQDAGGRYVMPGAC